MILAATMNVTYSTGFERKDVPIYMVTQTTVDAINGIRAAGFFGDVKAQMRTNGAYDLVAVAGGAVKASVDANGTITYTGD